MEIAERFCGPRTHALSVRACMISQWSVSYSSTWNEEEIPPLAEERNHISLSSLSLFLSLSSLSLSLSVEAEGESDRSGAKILFSQDDVMLDQR